MKQSAAKTFIRKMARPDGGLLAISSVLGALSACCGVGFALLSRRVLDIAVGDAQGNLWLYSALLMGALLVQIGLDISASYLGAVIAGRMDKRIKSTVFSALFRKRWQDVSVYHSGDVLNRLTGDCHVVVNTLSGLIPRTVSFAARMISCVAVLLVLDWRFTLVMLGLAAVLLMVYRLYGRKAKVLHKQCQEAEGHARSYMQEGVENWMVIQSFDAGTPVLTRLGKLLHIHYRSTLRRARWSNVSSAAMRLLFNGSYYAALAWGAFRLAVDAISYGTLMAFMQIIMQVRAPMINMSGLLPQYYNMLASAERLVELESLPDEPRGTPLPPDIYRRIQGLRIRDVHFAYDEEHPVLKGASLTVDKGEFVALAGFSGIGKSTLFKLLLGFYVPASGTVELVTDSGVLPVGADTRPLFAYVPQQTILLSGTVRENLTVFCSQVDENALWEAIRVADVDEVIRSLPAGLDTPLGERGAGLSEGQLQRLAIARAVLSGAPILLLDEVTASLDEDTEERVLTRLRSLPDRTCLCISHRPAALSLCDRVIRVEDGHIVT